MLSDSHYETNTEIMKVIVSDHPRAQAMLMIGANGAVGI